MIMLELDGDLAPAEVDMGPPGRLARSMLRRLELVDQAQAELDAMLVDAFGP